MKYIITNDPSFNPYDKFDSRNLMYQNFSQISVESSLKDLGSSDIWGLDIETTGLDPHVDTINLIQFGNYNDQYIIDCNSVNIQYYAQILISSKILKVGHGLKFDLQFFYVLNIFPENVYDTMLAEYVLYNGVNSVDLGRVYNEMCTANHLSLETRLNYAKRAKFGWSSLQALVWKYYTVFLSKEERANFKDYLNTEFLIYAAADVKYVIGIRSFQLEYAKQTSCVKAIDLDNRFLEVLAYVEYAGITLDKDRWTKIYIDNLAAHKQVLSELDSWIFEHKLEKYIDHQCDLFNPDKKATIINWNSSQQIIELLVSIGIDPTDKHGKASSDQKVLKKLKSKSTLIPLLLRYSKIQKALSTYGLNCFDYIHPKTGRIHSTFTQLVDSSRISSREPNITNIPKEAAYRHAYVPHKGWKFCDADYSGQESVVLTNRSKEKNLIKFFKESPEADLHSYVAKLTFVEELKDCPEEQVKDKFPKIRDLAKGTEFAIAYGGDHHTIANNADIPLSQAKKVYDDYFVAFPDLKDYFQFVGFEARSKGYILISEVTGRRFYFPEYKKYTDLIEESSSSNEYLIKKLGNSFQKLAQNYPIQGTSAEITKLAAYLFFKFLRDNMLTDYIKIVNVVHDELLIEYLPKYEELVSKQVVHFMELAGSYFCKIIPLKADVKFGDYWVH